MGLRKPGGIAKRCCFLPLVEPGGGGGGFLGAPPLFAEFDIGLGMRDIDLGMRDIDLKVMGR